MRLNARLKRAGRTRDGRCVLCGRELQVPLVESAEWQDLRTRIVEALQGFPEAKQAVLDAIRGDRR